MAIKPFKAYRVSFTLSLLVTAFVVFLNALLLIFFTEEELFSKDKLIPFLLSVSIIFPVCFIIFYYRIEAYAYKQVKELYNDLDPSFNEEFNDILITNDMDSLINNVKQASLKRSVEIDSLKDQETLAITDQRLESNRLFVAHKMNIMTSIC